MPSMPQNPYGQQPPPPPGPYGRQPPPPPYGQQATPPQGPYARQPPQSPGPYGQQPPGPQGPYAPYAQQPYGWGAPPVVPPPKKRRVGLVLGIVGGVIVSIVVVLALIGLLAESGFPAAKFELTLPKTLLDGRYELAQDLSDSQGRRIKDEADGAWDAKVTDAVVGQYTLGGDQTKGVLVISGMYGRFQNTNEARDNMLKGAAEADGVTLAGGPKTFTQDGLPTVSCEVLTQKKLGTTMTYPVCAWTDDNTGAMVAPMTEKTATQDPSDVQLSFYARLTLQVRSETVKPIQ